MVTELEWAAWLTAAIGTAASEQKDIEQTKYPASQAGNGRKL